MPILGSQTSRGGKNFGVLYRLGGTGGTAQVLVYVK